MGNFFPMSKYVSESELSIDSESDFEFDNSVDTRKSHSTSLITADASLRESVYSPDPRTQITLDKVNIIQNHLDEQDMISMIYLLFDQPLYALQEIALWRLDKDRRVLYEWASLLSGNGCIWKNQLVEALCILRNYHILKELGYEKESLKNYLPQSPYTSIYVNKLRKMLYIICEKLNSFKTENLIEYVREDHLEKKIEMDKFSEEPQALELYLLDWESHSYITQTNVENLMKIFKVMEEEELYNMLDTYYRSLHNSPPKQDNATGSEYEKSHTSGVTAKSPLESTNAVVDSFEESSSNLFSKYFLGDVSDETYKRTISKSVDNQQQHLKTDQLSMVYRGVGDPESLESNFFEPVVEKENRFYINPDNPGVVLIINQEHFYTETMEQYRELLPKSSEQLEQRTGTGKDKMRLSKTFEKFGFKVIIEDNLKHMDMVRCIKQTVADAKAESSLFICILSHGDKGIVYGANSCRVPVTEIQDIMCKQHLVNKPKVLILQSCQGWQCIDLKDQQQEYVESQSLATDGPTSLPLRANLLTFWASIPGFAAIRHKEKGSWFIQSLCEKIEACQDRYHFLDICTRVNQDVSEKKWIKGTSEYKMISEVHNSFLQDFFLPKIRF